MRSQLALRCLFGISCITTVLATPFLSSDYDYNNVPKRVRMTKRDTCQYMLVQSDSGCWQMAQDCGISQDDLSALNPGLDCFTIQAGDPFCCTSGDLPNFAPQSGSDGICATYTYDGTNVCSDIAKANHITVDEINDFNKDTWGWAGCNALQVGQIFCLSSGDPPMPAPSDGAICGPQVPGTSQPPSGTNLASLNPCSLNACCNVWGQCGITSDFCIVSPADTGAPGTRQPGTNSCISNCGMDIVDNDGGPSSFMKVTYFEAWNSGRSCLTMSPDQIDTTQYTHIHFAFANIGNDLSVDIDRVQDDFNTFKAMTGIKKIISFGGWAFSTDAPTYTIFGDGMSAANRLVFAASIANFVNSNGLDGVDFDWEYPSAPAGAGVPGGSIQQGHDYLAFLQHLRQLMPNKSISFAAPASYWYLRGFPIQEMAETVDYVIYMTYDLHGQWDYGNKWADGNGIDCPTGNCLRSHVNSTETQTALVMITKAGVPTNKVVVGVSSYGRSFHMAQAGCDGPECLFTGSATVSDAAPGRCTNTSGYIANAEIDEIIARGDLTRQWYDAGTDTDYIVYDDLEWVAYMSNDTKARRQDYYKSLNFAGTTDWAVDLQSLAPGSSANPGDVPGSEGRHKPQPLSVIDTPVITSNFADPSLLKDGNTYYAFATDIGGGIPYATSPDFALWQVQDTRALAGAGSWSNGKDLWAPSVTKIGNQFVMYYTAQNQNGKHCIGVATSGSPAGPYKAADSVLTCADSQGGIIDAFGYTDYDGSNWVIYKIDGNSIGHGGSCGNTRAPIVATPIMAQRLSGDGTTLDKSNPVQLLDRDNGDGPLIEAPAILRVTNGDSWTYFLFFSSGCYSDSSYDTSYAVSHNGLLGPYTKATAKQGAPILKTGYPRKALYAPGGLSTLDGYTLVVFHADLDKTAATRQMYAAQLNIDAAAGTASIFNYTRSP